MSQQTTPTLPRELPAELLSETFLLEMMKENLNQARHVENERMMFVTLFTALTGALLAVVGDKDTLVSSAIIILLAVLNTVCFVLTQRWNRVFKAHWEAARQIGCYLSERDPINGYDPDFSVFQGEAFWESYRGTNRYFCFDNQQHKHYVRTSKLFSLFNVCIYILLALLLVYVNLDGLQQLF